MKTLSHIDEYGNVRMVDVSAKPIQIRTVRAAGRINLPVAALKLIKANKMKKGDVLTVAQIAGIQAAKRTADLIPLCHTITLDNVHLSLSLTDGGVDIVSEVRSTGKTGAEMEALTAVSTGLLTIYDMCKAVAQGMEIGKIRLLDKRKEDA